MTKTGILLSGGIDSCSLAFWKVPSIAFTVDYGQVCAEAEIRSATQIARILNMRHEIIHVDCSSVGSGDLANTPPSKWASTREWWPFRNQLIITLVAGRAIDLNVKNLLLGIVKEDRTHKDSTRQFLKKIDNLVAMQEGHIRVLAPAVNLTSTELVRRSKIKQRNLAWSHSCHKSNFACGRCRGCFKHQNVMKVLGYGVY